MTKMKIALVFLWALIECSHSGSARNCHPMLLNLLCDPLTESPANNLSATLDGFEYSLFPNLKTRTEPETNLLVTKEMKEENQIERLDELFYEKSEINKRLKKERNNVIKQVLKKHLIEIDKDIRKGLGYYQEVGVKQEQKDLRIKIDSETEQDKNRKGKHIKEQREENTKKLAGIQNNIRKEKEFDIGKEEKEFSKQRGKKKQNTLKDSKEQQSQEEQEKSRHHEQKVKWTRQQETKRELQQNKEKPLEDIPKPQKDKRKTASKIVSSDHEAIAVQFPFHRIINTNVVTHPTPNREQTLKILDEKDLDRESNSEASLDKENASQKTKDGEGEVIRLFKNYTVRGKEKPKQNQPNKLFSLTSKLAEKAKRKAQFQNEEDYSASEEYNNQQMHKANQLTKLQFNTGNDRLTEEPRPAKLAKLKSGQQSKTYGSVAEPPLNRAIGNEKLILFSSKKPKFSIN